MTNTLGGQPLNPTSSASGAGAGLRMVGQAVSSVASRLVTVTSGVILSDNAIPNSTIVGLDTAPDTPVAARSVAGRLPLGARVVCLLYPPRGVLVLGRVDEAPATDSGWINPTFTNSWVDFAAGYQTAQYRKVGDWVYLRGLLKNGVLGSSAFTLPVDYRPISSLLFVSAAASATVTTGAASAGTAHTHPVTLSHKAAQLTVNTSGQIIPENVGGVTNGYIVLNGLFFSVLP